MKNILLDKTINIPNNEEYVLCFTEPKISNSRPPKTDGVIGIDCYLMEKKSGKIINPQNIKKNSSCPMGMEYREHIEQNAEKIANVLFAKMRGCYPEMAKNQIIKGNPITFGQFFKKKHPEIEQYYCWAPSTRSQYRSTILKRLSPKLEHKPLYSLTYTDYENAVNELIKEKKDIESKEFSKERIEQFWSNLSSVAEYACFCQICTENPIKKHKKLNPIKNAINDRQKRKSLNPYEIYKVSNLIAAGFDKSDMALGSALQMFLGLRTSEACGPNFRDVVYYEDGSGRCYLASYTQNRSYTVDDYKKYTAQKKTVNGYRFIPIPIELQKMIEEKRDYLKGLGFSDDEIEAMPLVSAYSSRKSKSRGKLKNRDNHPAKTRCESKMLGTYGKRTLYRVLKSNSNIELPYEEIRTEDKNTEHSLWDRIESDTQSYAFRRNFFTSMYGICGLEQHEVQYLGGHAQDDSRYLPTDFTSEEALQKLQKKMDRLIYIPDLKIDEQAVRSNFLMSSDPRERVETVVCENGKTKCTIFEDEIQRKFVFQPDSPDGCIDLTITLEGEELADWLYAEIESLGTVKYDAFASNAIRKTLKNTVNVTSFYYEDVFNKAKFLAGLQSNDNENSDDEFSESERKRLIEDITEEIEDYEKNVDLPGDAPVDIKNDEESEDDESDE